MKKENRSMIVAITVILVAIAFTALPAVAHQITPVPGSVNARCCWGQPSVYAAGVQYDWNKDFSIGAAYTLIDAGKAKVNQTGGPLRGGLEGDYDPNFIHAFNLNFVYGF